MDKYQRKMHFVVLHENANHKITRGQKIHNPYVTGSAAVLYTLMVMRIVTR